MSEDRTENLTPSFEDRVLTELAAINTRLGGLENRLDSMENRLGAVENRIGSLEDRLASLEEKVDTRLRETRPIWEGVQQRLIEVDKGLTRLNRQFKAFIADAFDLRTRVEKLEDELSTG